MREFFAKALYNLFCSDPNQIILCGDLGYGVLDHIQKNLPKQFLNMGISETHMLAFASGLALHKKSVWIYSMPSFFILRAAEALRNLICEPSLPIKLIASGSGLSYGRMGSTHHSIEDIALLKSMPQMEIYLPATKEDIGTCISEMQKSDRPSYLRIIQQGSYPSLPSFEALRWSHPNKKSSHESKTLIVSIGGALRFLPPNHESNVLVVGKYPLSESDLLAISQRASQLEIKQILTIEEHLVRGGLGESLRSDLKQMPSIVQWKHLGLRHSHDKNLGDCDFMCRQLGLSESIIESEIKSMEAQ